MRWYNPAHVSLEAGSQIGRYRIRSPLGKGGMGEVYRAEDSELGREVAVKILPAELAADAERMRRFRQEARAASGLNHPGILTVYEIGQDPTVFIATELVEGVTLAKRLEAGPLPVGEALGIAAQIAAALAAAHAAGVVHRDVKPGNVMLRPDGFAKVLDFGLAKLASAPQPIDEDEATRTSLDTHAGVVLGTARYMSPEQAFGVPVDARTDVWSLGVVLYEMVTGRHPFGDGTSGELFAAVTAGKGPQPVRSLLPDLPPELERILERALATNRDLRYASMHDLALDLKALRQALDFEARLGRAPTAESDASPGPAATPGARAARPASARRRALVVAGLLAVALATLVYLRPWSAGGEAIDSLAVLPLATAEGADADTALLADGLTESLINGLAQVPDLKVIGRGSSFRYRGTSVDPLAAARELEVRAVVTGRLARVGDQFQIGVELTDARDGRHLWGQQFAPRTDDLLRVQQDIARQISAQLRDRLTGEQRAAVGEQHTTDIQAYRLYLQGRHYFYRFPRPEYLRSREFFERAIALDPTYAAAHAGLADYYGFAAARGLFRPNEAWPKAEAAGRRALELDPNLADALNAIGAVQAMYHGDWPAAEAVLRRNYELNPNYPGVLFANLLLWHGRPGESVPLAERAAALDPLSVFHQRAPAKQYYFTRRFEDAVAAYRLALELDPEDPVTHQELGQAYERSGRPAEAVGEWSAALTHSGEADLAALLERTFAERGFDAAVETLARAQLGQLTSRLEQGEYVPAIRFAHLHLRLGEPEQALAWLAKAEDEPNALLLEIGVDPLFDPLRSDLRFASLLERLGLPAEPLTTPS